MIDLVMKFKMIRDYKVRKSGIVTACQSGMSHSIKAIILKNNNVTETVIGLLL